MYASRRILSVLLLIAGLMGAPPVRGEPPAEGQPGGQSGQLDRYGDLLPEGALLRLGTVRLRHGNAPTCIAFSPDGRLIASAAFNGDLGICLWESRTGKLIRQMHDPDSNLGWTEAIAFSPDGRQLAAGRADGAVLLMEVKTGRLLFKTKNKGAVQAVAFSPDGRRFASGGDDGKVRIWNAADGTQVKTFGAGKALHEGDYMGTWGITALAFSPTGELLAAGLSRPRPTIHVWNLDTGAAATRIEDVHGEEIRALSFTHDGRQLLSSGYRRISAASFGKPFPALTVHVPEIRLWDPATGKRLRELAVKEPEAGFGFTALSGDGKILASEASETIRLWDLASGSTIGAIPNPGWWGSHALAISPDGKTVAAATHCAIGLWDIATGKPRLQDFCGHTGSAVFLAHCPDGAMIVTGSNDGRVMAWDAKSGRRLYQRQLGRAGSLMAMALSPDGRLLAAGGRTDWTNLGSTNTVRLWRTKMGEPVRDFGGPDHPFGDTHRLAFSPDGKLLAIAADFRRRNGSDVDIYETESGKPVAALRPDRAGFRVAALGFAADAKTLYEVCDQPVEFRAWDVKSGKLQRFFVPHLAAQTTSTAGNRQLGISGALFSPDCKWLITCQQEASIVVWSVADGKAVSTVQLPGTDKGRYLGLSRDGRLLAAVEVPFALDMGTGATAICAIDSTTGSIRIWQRDAGRAALAAEAGDGRVLAFAFSPDNKHLATGMDRGTVLVWDLESTEGR